MKEETFFQFQSWIAQKTGIFISHDRQDSLQEKIQIRMQALKLESEEQYFLKLQHNQAEFDHFTEMLTIGETFFFRNEPQFEAIQQYVLPELIEKNKNSKEIKIWCAGCATGEEPYTLAILLKEIGLEKDFKISILATDINRYFLERAKKGIYSPRSVEHVPPALLEKYFKAQHKMFALSPEIKDSVEFVRHNLVSEPFTHPGMIECDVIFCRNVTIYFNLATTKRIIQQYADALKEKGFLFIGHAETLWNISEAFHPIEFPRTFIYQKGPITEKKPHQFFPYHLPNLEIKSPSLEHYSLENATTALSSITLPSAASSTTPNTSSEPSPTKKLNTEDILKKAVEMADQGKWDESIEILQQILQQDNLNTSAYFLLSIVLIKKGDYPAAIAGLRKLLYADSHLAMGYFQLGNLYRLTMQPRLAKKEYKNCLKLLEKIPENESIELSDGMTAGVLYQATRQNIELLEEQNHES